MLKVKPKSQDAMLMSQSTSKGRENTMKAYESPMVWIRIVKTGRRSKAYLAYAKTLEKQGKAKIEGFVK